MNLIDSFLLATAVTYLAATIFSMFGKPPLDGIPATTQSFVYIGLFSLICLSFWVPSLNNILAFIYSFSTVSSFMGWPQKWMSYWKSDPHEGGGIQQVGMAAWDLLLAIAFFMRTP